MKDYTETMTLEHIHTQEGEPLEASLGSIEESLQKAAEDALPEEIDEDVSTRSLRKTLRYSALAQLH